MSSVVVMLCSFAGESTGGDPCAVGSERDTTGDVHRRHRRLVDSLGVQHRKAGVACGVVMGETDQPAAVFGALAGGVCDEHEFPGMGAGPEVVGVAPAG